MPQRALLLFAVALTALGCGGGANTAAGTTTGTGGEGGAGGSAQPQLGLAAVPTTVSERAPMHVARAGHTATLLADGTVLVVGGEDLSPNREMLASVERYDPASDLWTELAPLPEPRVNHTATLLADGLVLIVGGGKSNAIGVTSGLEVRSEALLYDPALGSVVAIGPNLVPRHGHFAGLLPSGRVLIAAGAGAESTERPSQGSGNPQPFGNALASAEIFDPKTRAFTQTGGLAQARYAFGAASLADGRVLIAGGASYDEVARSHATAEVYDEALGGFAQAGSFQGADRLFPGAALLADGRALVLGGKKSNVGFLGDFELYDPATGAWQAAGAASPARTLSLVVPTAEGGALFIGGYTCSSSCSALESVDIWHPDGSITAGPQLSSARALATATVLADGSVLVVGGYKYDSQASVELLQP